MSLAIATPAVAPDLATIKVRQRATWASGDFAVIGTTLQIVGESLAEAVDVRAGERVLDVALSTFGARAAQIHCPRRHFNFRYRSAAHWVQAFRDFYGPTHKAFAALDEATRPALERDISALFDRMNTAGVGSLVVPGEYL